MASLSQKFKQLVETFVLVVPEDAVLASLCQELVLKICHTMSNDFLRNVRTLEQFNEKREHSLVSIASTSREKIDTSVYF